MTPNRRWDPIRSTLEQQVQILHWTSGGTLKNGELFSALRRIE